MARKNFRIRPEGGNDFADVLHPETNVDMVLDKDGNPMLHDYVRFPGYAIASGINNYTITLDPRPKAYTEGMRIAVKIGTTNTGKATLNINELGAKALVNPEGEELEAGDLLAGQVYNLIYNGAVFQLLGKGGDIEYGDALPEHVLEGKTISTEEGLKVGTMINRGSVSNTIKTQNGTFVIPKGFHNGAGTIKASFNNLLASNVKKGVNIGGVTGSFVGGWSYIHHLIDTKQEYSPGTYTTLDLEVPRGVISSTSQIKMIIVRFNEITTRAGGSPVGGGYGPCACYIASEKHPFFGASVGYGPNRGVVEFARLDIIGSNIRMGFDVRVGDNVILSIDSTYGKSDVYIYYSV